MLYIRIELQFKNINTFVYTLQCPESYDSALGTCSVLEHQISSEHQCSHHCFELMTLRVVVLAQF